MRTGIVAFLLGVVLLHQQAVLPDPRWIWLLGLVCLVPFVRLPWRIIIMLILGFLWAALRAQLVLGEGLQAQHEGQDLRLTGVIASIPQRDTQRSRFEFDVETVQLGASRLATPGKVRLSWYAQPPPRLPAGSRWQLWVRLKRPHGLLNPGSMDYESWLYQHHIRATGYVRVGKSAHQPRQLESSVSGYYITTFRQKLFSAIQHYVSGLTHGGVLTALALGERGGITPQQWQVFRATGTSHLVAISGLHIGLVAGFLFVLIRRLWASSLRLSHWLAAPRAAAVLALLFATGYAVLAGLSIPTQRALIMLLVVFGLSLFRQRLPASHVLAMALLAVLLFDPGAVLAAGFWLSFAAVGIILLSMGNRLSVELVGWKWLRLQWRISLALIPLLWFLFQHASLSAPLANLVAIPVVSFLVVPLVLLSIVFISLIPGLAGELLQLANTLLSGLWWVLEQLSDLPGSQWQLAITDVGLLLMAMLGMFILLLPRGWPAKWLASACILPLLWPMSRSPAYGEYEFTLLDVGQGLAATVLTQHHSLVFDTGPQFGDAFDTGAAVVVPYLQSQRVKNIDVLIISHSDSDHRGGLVSVREQFTVGRFLTSYGAAGSERCQAGQHWQWDGVYFELLHPPAEVTAGKRNNLSCVLRVSNGYHRVLITGDIEKPAERSILRRAYSAVAADIMTIPHHGSRTSSLPEFILAAQPQYALVATGYRNRYRLPHASIIRRYQQQGIAVLDTASSGAIQFYLRRNPSLPAPRIYRKIARRFWHLEAPADVKPALSARPRL